MKKWFAVGSVGAAMLVSTAAHAEGFGKQSTLVYSAERVWGYAATTASSEVDNGAGQTVDSSSTSSGFGFYLPPQVEGPYAVPRIALDYFVVDNLTVGAGFGIRFGGSSTETDGTEQDGPSTFGVLVSPRVGYGMMFTDMFGIWPRLGVTYFSESSTSDVQNPTGNGTIEQTSSLSGLSLNAEVPLVVAPTQDFQLFATPLVDIPLSGSRATETGGTEVSTDVSVLNFGILFGIGGNITL